MIWRGATWVSRDEWALLSVKRRKADRLGRFNQRRFNQKHEIAGNNGSAVGAHPRRLKPVPSAGYMLMDLASNVRTDRARLAATTPSPTADCRRRGLADCRAVPVAAPEISIVIRSKDEADRLRLTLASLEGQMARAELVVVDDGSADHTPSVLDDAATRLPLHAVRHATAQGRSSAANAGAAVARAPLLLFLDGDTLAGPDLVARHLAAHRDSPHVVVRGDTWHLRCTRLLQDPEAGTPFPEQADALASRPAPERERMRVTAAQIRDDFAAVAIRGQPAIYPGGDPRRLYETEMAALTGAPDCPVLWAAAAGSNQSVERDAFLAAGGFHPGIDINEHRELALKLCRAGARMTAAPGARSFHMTHRSQWRDPLRDRAWEAAFLAAQPAPAVALLVLFWASLAGYPTVAGSASIGSLPALAAAAAAPDAARFDAAREMLGFAPMGPAFWATA
jgi:GT2 family glycosyltransferase